MSYDLVALGRVSLDLFSTEVGAPFERIPGFDLRVGGSPSNVAIGASRLGLKAALLTAVGADRVGDTVLRHLRREGVDAERRPDLDARVARWSSGGVALVKRGGRGVSLLRDGSALELSGFAVEVVNTVGAGDAFAAGLIYGWLHHGDWEAAVRIANAAGALQVTRAGCSDTMPTRPEVDAFLQQRPR